MTSSPSSTSNDTGKLDTPIAEKDSLGSTLIKPSANEIYQATKAGLGAQRIDAQTHEEKALNSVGPPEPPRSIGGWRWVLAGKNSPSLTSESDMCID